jgi:hypothetical protein
MAGQDTFKARYLFQLQGDSVRKVCEVWEEVDTRIKCLDIQGKAEIAVQVNDAIMKGEIPTDWRDCNMAVLPKPNKDHT